MPSVQVEIRRAIEASEEEALVEAVHLALCTAFKIQQGDRNVRLLAHEPQRFACPPQLSNPELYTYVCIDAFAGRTVDAKRALYREIVANLEQLGIPKDHVMILLRESPKENWGIRGGRAGCDIELGFTVDV